MKFTFFNYKSPNLKKLADYGFVREGQNYCYITTILNGQFEMRVNVADGDVKTELIDLGSGEPYTLHLVEGAGGAFVGEVHEEFERVLTDVAEKCFDPDVFKGDCAHTVINYVRERYGDELEFLWKTFPSNAVWRRKDNKKWYAVLLTVSKAKLGLNSDEVVCIIDLRISPDVLPNVVDGVKYFPGYHMNKKSWFTICLDGSVPAAEICEWLDKSYNLAKK